MEPTALAAPQPCPHPTKLAFFLDSPAILRPTRASFKSGCTRNLGSTPQGSPLGDVKHIPFIAWRIRADILTRGRIRWSTPLPSPETAATTRPCSILARALIAGDQSTVATAAQLAETLGHHWRWFPPLTRRYLHAFAGKTHPRHAAVLLFLRHDSPLQRALERHAVKLAQWIIGPHQMQPVSAARTWPIRPIPTTASLADWLSLTLSALAWFADRKHLAAKAPSPVSPLHHYH